MSLFSTLNVGASGLGVSSASLSVIGDNIANVNTTGFKQTRASFWTGDRSAKQTRARSGPGPAVSPRCADARAASSRAGEPA